MLSLLFWSWIFISLIRPGFALPISSNYAKRALEVTSIPQENQTRTNIVAIAISLAVILVAVIAGIIFTIIRNRKKVEEPEEGLPKPMSKAAWFMVERGQVQWWRNFPWQSSAAQNLELPEGSQVERIKAALNKKKGKPILPLYNDSKSLPSPPEVIIPPTNPAPQYPDIRAHKTPLYDQTTQQQPSRPKPRTTNGRGPRSPPRAVVAQGLSRSLLRSDRRGLPRSPATRRKSWLSRAALRHPFLPLNTDAPLVTAPPRIVGAEISKLRLVDRPSPFRPIAEFRSKLTSPVSIKHALRNPLLEPGPLVEKLSPLRPIMESRSNLASPVLVRPASRPPPLNLDEEPRLEVRFGSPKVRIVSPAF